MNALRAKIEDRTARIGIMALGYTGLPEAVALARGGFPVTGLGLDPVRRGRVNAGSSYLSDVRSGIVPPLVGSRRLSATVMPSTPHPLDPLDVETRNHATPQPPNNPVLTL